LAIINNITNNLNTNKKSVLITFDLKKAFDCVNHKILIKKLECFCDENTVLWFKSYFTHRYSIVKYNKIVSEPKTVNLSVPQGGCLAPLLFIIFMNDIFELKLNGKLYLFADDMSLIINAKNYRELQLKIESDLNVINNWLKTNRLVLNHKKSNYMVMGSPLENTIRDLRPVINGKPLIRVKATKILGINLDNNLKFDSHIDILTKELNSRLYLISNLRKYLPENTVNFVYKSIIRPKLEYGCQLWGFTYNKHIEKLLKVQKRFARIITKSSFVANSSPLYERLNWKSLLNAIKFESMIYIFKSINGLNSEHSRDLFEINVNRTSRRTGRDGLYINEPKSTKNFLFNTIFCKGVKLWNSLPFDMRSETTIRAFKTRFKDYSFDDNII